MEFNKLRVDTINIINEYSGDIVLDEKSDHYIYVNITTYEERTDEKREETDQVLKKINTMYWLLQRRKIESDRLILKETNDLKNKIKDLKFKRDSLNNKLDQIKNKKGDIINNTIIETIDSIINNKLTIT